VNIKTEFKIDVSPFYNYKDWFYTEDDKQIVQDKIYKTKLQVFLDDKLLVETKVAINFCVIHCNFIIQVDKSRSFKQIRMIIDEMGIFREKDIGNINMVKENIYNINYSFNFVK